MTWLYVPGTTSAFAPEEEGSTSELTSEQAERLAQSVSWKTKQRPARSWSTTWKRGGFIRLLSGVTCEPSTLERGVVAFRDSLVATRASRSRTQASASAPTIPATSGPSSLPGFESSNQTGASSRTSALICDSDSTKSPETFKAWTTELRRSCLQRKKSVLRMAGNASSSWPTARATDGTKGGQPREKTFGGLAPAAAMWPTARASYNENRTTQDAPSHGVTHGRTLAGAAGSWPTPDAAGGGRVQSEDAKEAGKKAQVGLDNAAKQWQTPAVFQGKYRRQVGQTERAEELLPAQAESVTQKNWQTPNAAAEAPNLGSNIKNGPKSLLAQAQWATPVASDDGKKVTSASLQPGLIGQSSDFAGRLDPEKTGRLSLNAYGRPRLNPRFVEGLMGCPIGWTSLVATNCTSWATASSPSRQPEPGVSSSMPSSGKAEPHMADVQPGRWHGHWRGRCSCGWRGESRTGSAHAHAAVEKHLEEAI